MALLWQGTTIDRANRILANGPDEHFVEPGGHHGDPAGGFSTTLAGFIPLPDEAGCENYARLKANVFPNEGGPAIVEVEVPDLIVDIVLHDPVGQFAFRDMGEIRFVPGYGLEELQRIWSSFPKRMIKL